MTILKLFSPIVTQSLLPEGLYSKIWNARAAVYKRVMEKIRRRD
jgi:hypothetical protein